MSNKLWICRISKSRFKLYSFWNRVLKAFKMYIKNKFKRIKRTVMRFRRIRKNSMDLNTIKPTKQIKLTNWAGKYLSSLIKSTISTRKLKK